MYDNFKILNYSYSLVSPELYARHLSRLFTGNVIDGLTLVPKTGLIVTLQPGNAMIPYGTGATASARLVSLVADFDITLSTADASNPRIDSIVCYVDSVTLGSPTLDGQGVWKAAKVNGTPNASPVAPDSTAIQAVIGSGKPYFVAYDVRVDATVTTIAANKITDRRTFAVISKGLALGAGSYVDSGCVWSISSGLNGAMTAGLIYMNIAGVMVPVPLAAISSRAFTASKDTYVSVNVMGAITYAETTNGGVRPTLPASSLWLAKVVTSGAAITSIIDMRIKAGTVQLQCNFKAYRNAAYNSVGSATTKVPYDTAMWDQGGNFDTTNNQFVAPVDGYYNFTAGIGLLSATSRVIVMVWVNGAERGRLFDAQSSGAYLTNGSGSDDFKLTTGDIVDIRYFVTNASIAFGNYESFTWFSGKLTGRL